MTPGVFCSVVFLDLGILEIGPGLGRFDLVYLPQLPQVNTLDMPVLLVRLSREAGVETPWALVCFFVLPRSAFSVSNFNVLPWPGIMTCPQQLQTCCRWVSDTGTSLSTSNEVRRLMRNADVSGAEADSR